MNDDLLRIEKRVCGEHVTEVIDKSLRCTLCNCDLSGTPLPDRLMVLGGNTTVIASGMCEPCWDRFHEAHPDDIHMTADPMADATKVADWQDKKGVEF